MIYRRLTYLFSLIKPVCLAFALGSWVLGHILGSLVPLFWYAQARNFIKKDSVAQLFSYKFSKISKNIFSYRIHPFAASKKC